MLLVATLDLTKDSAWRVVPARSCEEILTQIRYAGLAPATSDNKALLLFLNASSVQLSVSVTFQEHKPTT